MKQFFRTAGQHDIVHPGADHRAGLLEGGSTRCTGVFNVYDRYPANTHAAQHNFAGNHHLSLNDTGGGIGHPCRLEQRFVHTGVIQSCLYCFAGKRLQGFIEMIAKRGHTNTGNVGVHFHGYISWLSY